MLAPSHYYQQTCGRPDLLETSYHRNKITTSLSLLWARSIFKDEASFASRILKVHPKVKHTHLQMNSLRFSHPLLLSITVFWVVTPCGLVDGYRHSEERVTSMFSVKSPWRSDTFSRNGYNYYKITRRHNRENHYNTFTAKRTSNL
jgi:hypothetical protein